jgi:sialidase-1
MISNPRRGLALLLSLVTVAATAAPANRKTEKRVFVQEGKPLHVVYDGAPWETKDGMLSANGQDRWVLASHGLIEGDFRITARLTIRGLRHSAARFSFDQLHAFGFEGNHGKIYLSGLLTPKGHGGIPHIPPAEAGIVDGKPFDFAAVRTGSRIAILINGREIYAHKVPKYTFDCFGFEARRATMEIASFAAEGCFSPAPYDPRLNQLWHHPETALQDTKWHGPFMNKADGSLLTMVNVTGGIQAFASADEGKTWQPQGRIVKQDMPFRIRDGNGDTLLLRTKSGVTLCAFLNIADEKISWDQKRREPLPDNKRWTWLARSHDDGKTWPEVSLIQEGYCGALRDILQLSTGELVLVGQDVANNPGRNFSMTYTSFDDGKTWKRSNNMDIGGHGDHSGTIEGTVEELRDGRLWILLRTYNGCFYESFSKDKGLTWTHPVPGKIKASGSPGILRRLASGRLVLLWNRFAKNRPRRLGRREELSMAFSNDDGTTWTPPVILLRLRSQRQSYPQVFERRPSELWVTTWQGRSFIKLKEADFVGK